MRLTRKGLDSYSVITVCLPLSGRINLSRPSLTQHNCKKDNAILSAFLQHSKKSILQLRTDEERKEASEIVLAAIEMKSSIEPQWIGEYSITLAYQSNLIVAVMHLIFN